jgi:hypothetical protein
MRRYSSSRMTDGTLRQRFAEWTWDGAISSAEATPFKTSTSARLAAQILIGS